MLTEAKFFEKAIPEKGFNNVNETAIHLLMRFEEDIVRFQKWISSDIDVLEKRDKARMFRDMLIGKPKEIADVRITSVYFTEEPIDGMEDFALFQIKESVNQDGERCLLIYLEWKDENSDIDRSRCQEAV